MKRKTTKGLPVMKNKKKLWVYTEYQMTHVAEHLIGRNGQSRRAEDFSKSGTWNETNKNKLTCVASSVAFTDRGFKL